LELNLGKFRKFYRFLKKKYLSEMAKVKFCKTFSEPLGPRESREG
jgi:hypothetical protein